MNYYEIKVKHTAVDEQSGKEKNVNPTYFVRAVSYTDAETQIHNELEAYLKAPFIINNIRKTNYESVIYCANGDKWFKAAINVLSICEQTNKEKKIKSYLLVQCEDINEVKKAIADSYTGCTFDYEFVSVSETKIEEVFENKE